MSLPRIDNRNTKRVIATATMADVSADGASAQTGRAFVSAPCRGKIVKVRGVLHGAITVADSIVTVKNGSTTITGLNVAGTVSSTNAETVVSAAAAGTITIATASSAAGDKYFMEASPVGSSVASGRVQPGDSITFQSDGGSTTTAAMTWIVEILDD